MNKFHSNKRFRKRWIRINRRLVKGMKDCVIRRIAIRFRTAIIIQF